MDELARTKHSLCVSGPARPAAAVLAVRLIGMAPCLVLCLDLCLDKRAKALGT